MTTSRLLCFLLLLTGLGMEFRQFEARAEAVKPRVVVFVHGIHGDRDTWRAPNGAYWPAMLSADQHFQKSDIVVVEYPTPSSHGQMSSVQLAQILWQRLSEKHVWDHKEVVFIAHSLGGLLTEEMLLNHPTEAQHVRFIVSYGTPHQESFTANLAKIYDDDPLLTDMQESNDNVFLMKLEQQWRGTPTVNRIHRFCAFESLDTKPRSGVGRYFGAHVRVVRYYSATFGCDTDTPPQEILADHIDMVKPIDQSADAYTFFARVYREHPIVDIGEVVRDNKISGLNVDCNRTKSDGDLQVPITLDAAFHEQLLSATAELVETDKIKDPSPTKVVKIDPSGIAHVSYGFNGLDKEGLFQNCPGGGHASVLVHFTIRREVPVKE